MRPMTDNGLPMASVTDDEVPQVLGRTDLLGGEEEEELFKDEKLNELCSTICWTIVVFPKPAPATIKTPQLSLR